MQADNKEGKELVMNLLSHRPKLYDHWKLNF